MSARRVNLNRLAERWERRQRERATLAQEEALEAHRRKPLELISVREHVDLRCSAARAWEFVVDPGNAAGLDDDPAALSCAVPGTPAGAVGEWQCTFSHRFDGAMIGRVEEVTALVPGSLVVARSLSTMHLWAGALELTADGDRSCRLAYEVSAEVHPEQAEVFSAEASRAARRVLSRAAHALDGRPLVLEPAAPPRGPNPGHESREVAVIVALAAVECSATAEHVWTFMLNPSNDRLDSPDPDALSFRVPGTPAGGAGELRCVIVHTAGGALVAMLQELIAIDRGRSFVTRSRSLTHAARTTTVVEALASGARLTTRLEIEVHPDEAESARRRFTAGAVHHLEAVRGRLESSADGVPPGLRPS